MSIILTLCLGGYAFAQNAAAIQRSQVLTNKEQALRRRIEEPAYILKIEISGVNRDLAEDVAAAVEPFKQSAMTKDNIQDIIETIRKVYDDSGQTGRFIKAVYKVRGDVLLITVKENPAAGS